MIRAKNLVLRKTYIVRKLSDKSVVTGTSSGNAGGLLLPLVIGAPVGLGFGVAYKCTMDKQFSDKLKTQFPIISDILVPFVAALKVIGIHEIEVNDDSTSPPSVDSPLNNDKDVDVAVDSQLQAEIIVADDKKEDIQTTIETHVELPQTKSVDVEPPSSYQSNDDIHDTTTISSSETFQENSEEISVEASHQDAVVEAPLPQVPIPSSSSISTSTEKHNEEDVGSEVRKSLLGEFLEDVDERTKAMRADIDKSLINDFSSLDDAALKFRLAQMNMELVERIKWEGIRLQETVRNVEEKSYNHYSLLLNQQLSTMEISNQKKLHELEKTLHDEHTKKLEEINVQHEKNLQNALIELGEKFNKNLRDEIDKTTNKVQQDLQDDYLLALARLREEHVKYLIRVEKDIAASNESLSEINAVIEAKTNNKLLSTYVHNISAAVLVAENGMHTSEPLRGHLQALAKCASDDETIKVVLKAIPPAAYTDGICTVPQLLERFAVVRDEVRKAALAPEAAPMLIGQIIGNMLAYITLEPSGNVSGDSIEAILARATYHMERNELFEAIREIEGVKGYPRKLMADWESLARDRLIINDLALVLRAQASLRHKQLS